MMVLATLVVVIAVVFFPTIAAFHVHYPISRILSTRIFLQPVEDPNASLNSQSLSGVLYKDVLSGLDRLYPPAGLSQRNAVSRTDGYWPYITDGSEPPLEFTYGEFDLPFFAEILDKAKQFMNDNNDDSRATTWDGKTFCDIGSGAGRLVISAAALHPGLRLCRGIEYLKSCHDLAQTLVDQCANVLTVSDDDDSNNNKGLPMAPIELTCGSIGDDDTYIGDVDVAFVFSSCMPPEVLDMVSKKVGEQCRPGTIVVTTDYEIPREGVINGKSYRLELLETVDAYCWVVGGTSTAYFYQVIQSCS